MQQLATVQQVVTGTTSEATGDEPTSPFAQLDRPVVVYVCDLMAGDEGFDKLEEVVFKNEKIGLGMKAFRAVKMSPTDVDRDPILADQGSEVPRLLVVDPVKERVKVLEGSQLKVSTLFSAMKSVAGSVWKENLDKVVKAHLKLLTERDQLANEMKVLDDKAARAADDERKLAEIEADKAEVQKKLEDLAVQERELWQLTRKDVA